MSIFEPNSPYCQDDDFLRFLDAVEFIDFHTKGYHKENILEDIIENV